MNFIEESKKIRDEILDKRVPGYAYSVSDEDWNMFFIEQEKLIKRMLIGKLTILIKEIVNREGV